MPLTPRKQVVIAALAVAAGIASITTGVMLRGSTGPPPIDPRIERLIPAAQSEVLTQETLGIDLIDTPRFKVELYLNGIRIPNEEMIEVASTNRVVYRSGAGQTIESLRADRNCLRAVFHPLAQDPDSADRGEHVWCFNAS